LEWKCGKKASSIFPVIRFCVASATKSGLRPE
jgi:hypothetical protein